MAKRRSQAVLTPVNLTTVRTHEELRALYLANAQNPSKHTFEGFSTAEIAEWNRRLMFGENDEGFPSQEEWSAIVD